MPAGLRRAPVPAARLPRAPLRWDQRLQRRCLHLWPRVWHLLRRAPVTAAGAPFSADGAARPAHAPSLATATFATAIAATAAGRTACEPRL